MIEGLLFLKSSQNPKNSASKAINFSGQVTSFGGKDEFTITKDGKDVFSAKASDQPPMQYRLSMPRRVSGATWQDLKLGDNVNLVLSYDSTGKVIKYRVLYIYRTAE